MKLLALTALLTGVESQLSHRDNASWRRFGGICRDVNVTDTNTDGQRSWTLEGICGKYGEKKRATYDLDGCVGNENGGLVWRKDGSFSSTCERCVGYERGPNVWLQCWCTKKDGEQAMLDEYPMLDLNDHIAWDKTRLQCKL